MRRALVDESPFGPQLCEPGNPPLRLMLAQLGQTPYMLKAFGNCVQALLCTTKLEGVAGGRNAAFTRQKARVGLAERNRAALEQM